MLDLKFVRENHSLIRKDLEKRKDKEKLPWLNELLKLDEQYRKKLQEAENLRAKRNEITNEVKKLLSEKKDAKKKIAEAKSLPDKIKKIEKNTAPLKEKIDYYLMRLPNVLDESVPYGKDDSENVVVKEAGKKISRKDLPPHGELLEKHGWADFDRAAKIAGSGFYFLKGQFALLDFALQRFALDKLVKKGYSVIQPPLMMNREAYSGVTDLNDFENVMYKIDSEDLYLIATSEHPMAAMFKDEILSSEELPIKFAGISPCFRKEIGKHGIDTRGIFRVHQFNKVEQFVFCKPEESEKFHEELLENAEEIFKELGLAYRVVNICTGDIGIVAAKKYDMDVWMPREEKYREVVSNSNCTTYQAVRSNIKFRNKDGSKEFVHTLNSTAIATSRALRALLETHYDKGVIKIPKPLQPYMNGAKEIKHEK
ncbi:MAG: serine--tRNA ligase [Candidatus Diapherotrites archaeon]|uniref:Serine--tRNA ligase n=1 Tax=Candidatus Iainarchaeum sp. TaxID=3101447 RepID=A0A2D6LQ75_9ARCH|nr:serine--tRNA ligase [Candidatus Diapherotrites archaeon]|tara:strand:+ start:20583 stop:21860 length:1278 start_codon:yes stop_codon:yes gene_type:complete